MESGGELIRGDKEKIYVSVRLRPLNDKEDLSNDVSDWECINNDTIVYKNVSLLASERSMHPTAYTFDRVFRSDCSTREVYEQGAKDVAISVSHGTNANIFTYGQTSSGKTHTMTGIIEYAIADIYVCMQKHPERDFTLKFSAIKIYDESVRDLLSVDNTSLELIDDPERGTIVEKLTEETLRDWNHVTRLLSTCQAQRRIGETSLNERGSISHQIIRLTVESSSRELLGRNNASKLAATVNFVDLAGNEQASQSLTTGCHIDRSLMTLQTVICKLSKEPNGDIPYRDSTLTRILQMSLGGNARSTIICTMSPARSHVEQSKNTLLFASCAMEVTTDAQVNVVISDEALIKHLQKELARLESELRGSQQYTFAPPNYPAIIREKDTQIEKLENEIKNLILQRDIAQSQVKEYIQMLGDDVSSMTQVGVGHYPHLRVKNSPIAGSRKQENSILVDPTLDVDTATYSDRDSQISSSGHLAKVPFFAENFVDNYAPPRIILSSSNSCGSDTYYDWDDIDKQSNGTSEDLCREVFSIEKDDLSNRESFEEYGTPAVKMHANSDWQDVESASSPLVNDQGFMSSPLKDNDEVKEDKPSLIIPSKEGQEQKSASIMDGKESISPIFREEKEDLTSILDKPDLGSEKQSKWCVRKVYTLNFGPSMKNLSRQDCQSPPENPLDIEIEIDWPGAELSNDDSISSTPDIREKEEQQNTQEITTEQEKEIAQPNDNECLEKNVKNVGLDPVGDEFRGLTSWPVEFKRLQKEMIELWHACNVSLVHRTYFFLLFQGDPSDAIYLQVEIKRMKSLKDTFSCGDKTVVNGRHMTLSSSAKALRQERRMLIEQMMKKFSEQEREILFVEWGIGLNSKYRRLQLANLIWTKIKDIKHITDSAVLVAKVVGIIEPKQALDDEMHGVNLTPKSSTGICSFKRSLHSLF